MIQNYFKIAWRNIAKSKIFSSINILGLAIGMAASIVILTFVFFEKSFDNIHTKNIYRLNEVQSFPGMVAPQKVALSMFPMGPTLKEEFPEIKDFVRVRQHQNVPILTDQKRVELNEVLWVDDSFFNIFDFELIEGNRTNVLNEPNTAVLTKEAAYKIFGNENPIGKSFQRLSGDTLTIKVTGIMENVSKASHLQFDGVFSFSTITRPDDMNNWGRNWLVTYLELENGTNIKQLEAKFPEYELQHLGETNSDWYELFLQPLSEVHSNSTDITHDYVNHQKFDKTYVYIFTVIAIIILVIACINFMNLSTARSITRAKEVGLRKSIGAFRTQVAFQFLTESTLFALIALFLAIGIVLIVLPSMASLSERDLAFPLFTDPKLLLTLVGGAVLIGLISGIYPALYLSGFNPVSILKGTFKVGKSHLRNTLVVIQFTCAVVLIIGTSFAIMQLNFMQEKDPGFNKEQVLLVPLNYKSGPLYSALKQEFESNAFVKNVSASQQRLGNNLHQTGVNFQDDGPIQNLTSSQIIVDPDFIKLYDIELLAGRDFQAGPADNARTYIVNESLAQELLKEQKEKTYESLLGKRFGFMGMDSLSTIVAVCRDFNFNSLHNEVETLCLFNQVEWGFNEMSVKIDGKNTEQAIASLEATWNQLLPNEPFAYSFLDQHFENLYKADSQVSEIVGILAGLAIFVSCLGLLGLATFSAKRRVKEIGVRKVLGSSSQGIILLISKDFMKLVGIAILIASPLAWYGVDTWLENFAYRVDIKWWVFVMAAALAIALSFLTVGYQALKAAIINPVKSLKSE